MKKLTTNKNISEMNMYELAHNSCYAKEGRARYRDYETDMDARRLAIKLLDKYADIQNEFGCEDDFDEFIMDSLQYGTDSLLGLIAAFYRNLWAMADLRERLKEYEDIGLTPEQLTEVDRLYAEKCRELADAQRSSFSGLEMVKIWAKLKKLKEYNDLEEQGKLLKLPCAVGDTVYVIEVDEENFTHFHCPRKISEYKFNLQMLDLLGMFGKCIFLTKEEAEAALKKMEEKKV